jgi:hypothetical protein
MTTSEPEPHRETIAITAAPATVRAAVDDVEGWWTRHVTREGDEFVAAFSAGWTRIRVDGPRWEVVAQDDPHLPGGEEWVGSTIRFVVEDDGRGGSVLHIEHDGLAGMACEPLCRRGWADCARSIRLLAETGAGRPFRRAPAASIGNHASVLVSRSDRGRIRDFYCGVLGGELTASEDDRDILRIGDDFFVAFLYGEVPDASELHRAARAMWLEIKAADVEGLRSAVIASGLVRVLDVPDPHLYLQAPGGQCLRLVAATEDLSSYEGVGAGPDVAGVKRAIGAPHG